MKRGICSASPKGRGISGGFTPSVSIIHPRISSRLAKEIIIAQRVEKQHYSILFPFPANRSDGPLLTITDGEWNGDDRGLSGSEKYVGFLRTNHDTSAKGCNAGLKQDMRVNPVCRAVHSKKNGV
jgi:hypothetical protein